MSKQLTVEQLERKVARLEKRVKELEAERDDARESVISKQIARILSRGWSRHRGFSLPSESCRLIRIGEWTIEQAIADRDERFPILTYGARGGLTLEQAYAMAK